MTPMFLTFADHGAGQRFALLRQRTPSLRAATAAAVSAGCRRNFLVIDVALESKVSRLRIATRFSDGDVHGAPKMQFAQL